VGWRTWNLYASVSSNDPTNPNVIAIINPLTGTVDQLFKLETTRPAFHLSDSSYLWAALDGANAVQRFLLRPHKGHFLPSTTKPLQHTSPGGEPTAAPASRTRLPWFRVIGENRRPGMACTSTMMPLNVPRSSLASWGTGGGPFIDWIQWGGNDSTIYGNQYFTIDQGGIATLNVTSSGVSFVAYNGGKADPYLTQYEGSGLLYSLGAAFNPVNGSLVATFDFPEYNPACTADSSLNRYFCVVAYPVGGTDVSNF